MRLLLLFSVLLVGAVHNVNAQNPALTANDWILTELNENGVSYFPSSVVLINDDVKLKITNSGTDYIFETAVCPTAQDIIGQITYPASGSNILTLKSSAVTLGTCCINQDITMPDSDCDALNRFNTSYKMFWAPATLPQDYTYSIQPVSNRLGLTITAPNSDYAVYENAVLSLKDLEIKNPFSLSNNPVSDQIIILNNSKVLTTYFTVFSINGKALKSGQLKDDIILVNDLPAGIYFVKLSFKQQEQTIKFIKL